MTTTAAPPSILTLADLVHGLGGIPLDRIRFRPAPGAATEQDVVNLHDREGLLCELVDGTLVEKGMGLRHSLIAVALASFLRTFVLPRNLGIVVGEAGMMRLFEGIVRIPDVAYVSWERMPSGRVPLEPVPALAPDLAVEVLSPSNTPREMARKRREYFAAGARLVWEVHPRRRTVTVYTGPTASTRLTEADILTGDPVLPGFALKLAELFADPLGGDAP